KRLTIDMKFVRSGILWPILAKKQARPTLKMVCRMITGMTRTTLQVTTSGGVMTAMRRIMTTTVGMKTRKFRTTTEIGSAASWNLKSLIIEAPDLIDPVQPVIDFPVNLKKKTPNTRKPRKLSLHRAESRMKPKMNQNPSTDNSG